jgi:hypothetical protein
MHQKTRRTARKLHLGGGTSAARRRVPANDVESQSQGEGQGAAVYDSTPGTPLSCTPIIMGRKARGLR